MKLTFLGTRGYIDAATDRHRRHTATLVEYRGKRVMIDCGEDWLDRFQDHNPQAIVLTHCHPDHAWGLNPGPFSPTWVRKSSRRETKKPWRKSDPLPKSGALRFGSPLTAWRKCSAESRWKGGNLDWTGPEIRSPNGSWPCKRPFPLPAGSLVQTMEEKRYARIARR